MNDYVRQLLIVLAYALVCVMAISAVSLLAKADDLTCPPEAPFKLCQTINGNFVCKCFK